MGALGKGRRRELERAKKLATDILHLRDACEIAPGAAEALNARIAELMIERAQLDPPLDCCEACGAEWDGRAPPPVPRREGCRHGAMREMWRQMNVDGVRRHVRETLDEFLARWDAVDGTQCPWGRGTYHVPHRLRGPGRPKGR